MTYTKKEKQYFDYIIDIRLKNINMCHQCGHFQTHHRVYCEHCNSKYGNHNHTMREAINIGKNIVFDNGAYANWTRPHYIAETFRLHLKEIGIDSRNFEEYLQEIWDSR